MYPDESQFSPSFTLFAQSSKFYFFGLNMVLYLSVPSTEYQSECETQQEVHSVEDDVVACQTVIEEKCQEVHTSQYFNIECVYLSLLIFVFAGDLWLHDRHQVQQVAKRGLHGRKDSGHKVQPKNKVSE